MSMLTQKLPLRVTITESPNSPLAPPSTHTHTPPTPTVPVHYTCSRKTALHSTHTVSASKQTHVLLAAAAIGDASNQTSRDGHPTNLVWPSRTKEMKQLTTGAFSFVSHYSRRRWWILDA